MTVIEIGPDTVRVLSGPGGPVDRRLAEAALQWIDDPVGLYDDQPVAVADLWRAVMVAASWGEPMVLVHPDDWAARRIDRVVAAANSVADDVTAVPRRQWSADLGDRAEPDATAQRPAARFALVAVAAAVVAALAATITIALWPAGGQTVSEGRITVRLPAGWAVTKVTGGPGSRRVQATAPDDPELAVHITQARATQSRATQSHAAHSGLAAAADVLRGVIAGQPAGVFVDFHADGRAGGRSAVTYREVRPGRVIDWSVVLAGSTLIGIGCQSPPHRTDAVRAACEQAVDSASESGTDPRP